MKKILIGFFIVLFFTGICSAKPFINTEPTSSDITEYTVTIDGVNHPVAPDNLGDGTLRLHFDVGPLNLSSGNHDATIKGRNDLWDLETNTIPFVFNKPAALTDPAGIGLSAD